MGKLLSIVIPYYDETPKDIFPLLSSIHNQIGIDFEQLECILVNDGNNNVLPDDFLSMFDKFDLQVIHMEENRGPGVARQVGIDKAVGEYVMFCDADDTLHNVGILGAFVQEMEQTRPDIITTPWLEEIYDSQAGKFIYIPHDNEMTWMHGKAFRRLFLVAEDITFHDELRVHEDSYLLAIADACTANKRKILSTSYVWKWRPNSITRCDEGAYTYNSMSTFLHAIGMSFKAIEPINSEIMIYKTVQIIMYVYFGVHQPHWLQPDKAEYLTKTETTFATMIKPYMHYFEAAPYEFICKVYGEECAKIPNAGIENERLQDWLKRLSVVE